MINNVLYTQADHYGIYAGKVDLTFDRSSRRLLHRAAVTVPRGLTTRIKRSVAETSDAATYGESVEIELRPQLWSLEQPFFNERLTQLRSRITTSSTPMPSQEVISRD